MSSDIVQAPIATLGIPKWQATSPRLGLRLTAAERKLLLIIVDLILLNCSLLLSTVLWNNFEPSVQAVLDKAKWFITLSIIWWMLGIILNIYDLARSASTTNIILSAGLAILLTTVIFLLIPWLTPPINTRRYIAGFVLLSEVSLVAWRVLYAQMLNQPAFWRRVLILGTGTKAQILLKELNQASKSGDANPFRSTGYQVVGMVADQSPWTPVADGDVAPLGEVNELVRLARLHDVDEIIVASDGPYPVDPSAYQVLLDCRELGLSVSPAVEVHERLTARLPVEYAERNLEAIWVRLDSPSARLYNAFKNLMDWALALVGLVLLALVLPCVAFANALWSPGPVFYRQQRMGKGGRPFAVIKFRSMTTNAEQVTGAMWSTRQDPRITPVGYWLRKTRLDELPQVVNVLRGEMSMVGPRPERPHFVGSLAHELPLYRARHAVKPGITGWAQVRYGYADSIESSREKLEYDLYYVRHAGLYLDSLILLQTFSVMLGMKGR